MSHHCIPLYIQYCAKVFEQIYYLIQKYFPIQKIDINNLERGFSKGIYGEPQAESFFWFSLDFWDEKEEIRDSVKVRTFSLVYTIF